MKWDMDLMDLSCLVLQKGGVTSMDDFLLKFFPDVYEKRHNVKTDNYCLFDSEVLTLFTSSLYLAALLTTLLAASRLTRTRGRKASILIGAIFFLLGSVLDAASENLTMLVSGRIALGIGLGFTCQVRESPDTLSLVFTHMFSSAHSSSRSFFATYTHLLYMVSMVSSRLMAWCVDHIAPRHSPPSAHPYVF